MKRICFIGDSLCEGHSDDQRQGWVGRLAMSLPIDFRTYNLGVSGQTMAEIQNRAAKEVSARMGIHEHKAIVLGAGLNDINHKENGQLRTSLAELKETIYRLIAELNSLAPLIVVGPFPIDETFNPFYSSALDCNIIFKNRAIQNIDSYYANTCKTLDVPYLSIFDQLMENSIYKKSLQDNDGIHPDAKGYKVAANIIQKWEAWAEIAMPPQTNN